MTPSENGSTFEPAPGCDPFQVKLIKESLGLVTAIAIKVRESLTRSLDLDELVALGREGLVHAARRFDPSRGVPFSSYAYHRIRGAIFDGVRRQGWLSRVEYGHFLSCANSYLMNLGDRAEANPPPSSGEERVSELTNTLEDLAAIFIVTAGIGEEDTPDPRSPDGFEALADKRTSAQVRQALARIPGRERRIIELHYFGELSLTDTGREMGLSKSWISRLHARAVRLLSEELAHLAEAHET